MKTKNAIETRAWITYDPDDNSVRDVNFGSEKPEPVHTHLRVVRGTISFEPKE
jgi:hypothetical protein